MKFRSKKPAFEYLRKKWLSRHRRIQDKLWEKHSETLRNFAVGSIGGLLLLSNPAHQLITGPHSLATSRDDIVKGIDLNEILTKALSDQVPNTLRPLYHEEEVKITDILSRSFGINVVSELNGIRLQRNYGVIGAEQHLYRYPGDTLYNHLENTSDWAMYGSSGIAPHLGAWGYFVPSKQEFSDIVKLRERYYLAIQTFLVPGYAENVSRYRDFFKFKKMLICNPKTGQSVVAVVGDAGPAEWTGKHLGGSPEVMHFLGLGEGPRRGAVLYFFIDDPQDKVPLGPVKVNIREI